MGNAEERQKETAEAEEKLTSKGHNIGGGIGKHNRSGGEDAVDNQPYEIS